MPRKISVQKSPKPSAMILGVGSFAHSIGQRWRTPARTSRRISPAITAIFRRRSSGKTFSRDAFPSPVPLLRENKIDVVIPQSIDWAQAAVGERFDRIRRRHFFADRRGNADRARTRFCARAVRAVQNSLSQIVRRLKPHRGGKNSRTKIRSRSSSKIRSARRPVRSTRFCARRSPTRARGCGR